jgi:hypothetical protein
MLDECLWRKIVYFALETFFEHGDLEERGRMTEGGVKA